VLALLATAAGQSLRIDESASKVILRGKTFAVVLEANSTESRKSAVVKLGIVTPTGTEIASSSFAAQLKTGTSKLSTSVSLNELPKKNEDLLWYRLAYSVTANGAELSHGILPLFESVQDFALHVSAPALVQPGKKFFVRVHTSHPVLGRAVVGVAIRAHIQESAAEVPLASAAATTDANGYAVLSMSLPADLHDRDLEVAVEAQRGTTKKKAENDLKVGAPSRIFVQTDKPLYQPGQTLHIRALIFGDEHRAIAAKKIYLQVEDENGTVVFRNERTSSRFGVVATDWTIPDRIRLGSYRILAKTYPGQYDTDDDTDDEDNPMSAAADRKIVRISRYELPTFVVNAKPDRGYYLPEQKASVEISAAYLFGKPVPKASVRIAQLEERTWNFSKQKWETEESEPISGTTDDQGTLRATLALSKERADLDEYSYRRFRDVTYTAYVTDPSTGRTEERRFDVRITKYPIHVYYVPQDSSRRGLPEEFFVSTSYADGSPAQCEVEVRTVAPGGSGERVLASVHTSRYGVARIRNPKAAFANEGKELPLILVARDRKGATGVSKENLWPEQDRHFLGLITKKTILAPEEPIEAEIHSDSDGEVVVELANQSKVLRSFTVRLQHHWAMVRIPFSSEFMGQLALAAINMEHAGGYWGGSGTSASRSVIYPQNRDLKIAVHLNQSEYRPGQDAGATVQVRTATGSAIPSVIGAVIFDKAVEERARIDEDLRDPFGFGGYGGWWYQGEAKLANLTRADLDRVDTNEPISGDLDIAADFLLNAYRYGSGNYSPVFGDEYDSESPRDVYRGEIDRTLQPLLSALDEEGKASGNLPRNRQELDALLQRHHLTWSDLKDPWNSEFIPTFSIGRNDYELQVFSRGPDKQVGTDDDFIVAYRSVSFYAATEQQVTRALEEYHRKNGGFVRDLPSLRKALSAVSIDLSKLIDPWGHPYIFEFGLNRAQFTVTAKTSGEDGKPGEEYVVGISAIDYFAETRAAINRILPSKIQAAGKTPDTPEEFKALLLPEVHLEDLRDPYGRPYLVRTAAVARYSDRWVQHNQHVKTEPVTVWNRLIKIRSMGADGIADTDDDFDVAVFSAVLFEVTATGRTSTPTVHALFTGNAGGISGVVTDPSGAVVPNTKIVAINANTNAEYETTTDSNGSYLLLDLPPGVYDVSVLATGFMKTTLRGIVVRAQEALELNATLQLAAATQTVEVSATTNLVATESAMVSTVNKPPTTDFAQQATVTPRLRQYFPETLLWQPSVETDGNGRARISWKFADNLTTWKLSLIASTLDGRLATIDKEMKSFQPFFVEHDPPKVLTLGDRISLPVVIRNYTDKSEQVKVEMPSADWFRSASVAVQEASLSPGGNSKLIFPFEAIATTATGKQRVLAAGSAVGDAIERSVMVHPDGAELTHTDGRIVSGKTTWDFDIPDEVIPGSVHADLKIYPDLLAHVTEALEGMLERPWGCGEQTISSTYPSVLLLKFEKERKRPLGALHDRAMRYVALGYTRLLTYIDDSGAVTYWGRGEPDLALTAYAVRFLHDASEFTPVDPGVLNRALYWLFQQQRADGGWVQHRWYASSPVEDAILTSYIARILASTQPSDPKDKNVAVEQAAIRRAVDNVANATNNFTDPYLFASYGLADMAAGQPKRAEGVLAKLRAAAETERGGSYWELQSNTPFYGWGHAGRVETTALAVQLLDRTGRIEDQALTNRGLEFLIEQKDRYGAWYSTQTTVNVIDALLLLASRETRGAQVPLKIAVNGSLQSLPINMAQTLGPKILDISSLAHPGKNTIEISGGNGTLSSAQAVTDYYVHWNSPLTTPRPGPLKLSVTCDRTHLEVGAKATCTVLAERIGSAGHGMMIAEIGIPPGVDVDREGLQKQMSENGWELSSFDILPDRIIAYVWPRAGGTIFSLSFTTRMAVDAQAAPHTLFDYYNPDASVTIAPDRFTVVEASVSAAGVKGTPFSVPPFVGVK
jgi:hypothetical protein